jgi:hypothetical protein
MRQGIIPRPMTPEEYGQFIILESDKFARVIDRAKIKPEG